MNSAIEVVAVEPKGSAVLSGKPAGPHLIQGIGAGFIPEVYDGSVVDRIVDVDDSEALLAARTVPRTEGLLIGISSGAVYRAAEILAQSGAYRDKRMVLIFADSGERYLSTGLYEPTDANWVKARLSVEDQDRIFDTADESS
jgi:cysteine synthase A